MSGLWGPQSSLDLFLQEEGINTLFFSGVNADQVSLSSVYLAAINAAGPVDPARARLQVCL